MSKIAVDIALLPPKEIMQICIDINRKDEGRYQVFNLEDNFPHITLAMGVLDTDDLQLAGEKLDAIADDFSKLKLELTEISYIESPQVIKDLMSLKLV